MAIIVRLFGQLILLSCVFVQYSSTLNDTDYILCTARCSPLTGSLTDPSAVLSDCQDNGSEDGSGIFDYALTCGITYTVDYNRQSIHVQFTASNATNDDEEARPQASLVQKVQWNLDEHAPGPKELSRTYSCSARKDCAREFFLQSIAALANDGREKLDTIKEKLYSAAAIVGQGARRRCIDSRKTGNKTSVKCGYGLCYGRFETYELDEEKNSKSQRCENPQRSYLLSEIERHTPKSTRDKQVLELVCNKNVCNRNDLRSKIEGLLQDYTQWTPDAQDENAPAATDADVAEKSAPAAASNPQTLSSSLALSLVVLLQLVL